MSLYDDASLIMYPSGVKASKIYCQKPTDGSGDLTFTRASTATRVNSSGLIETVASNVPRIDYTGGGCGKLLLEPQRTNLLTRNREFNLWVIPPTATPNSTTSKYGDTVYSYYGSATQTGVTVVSNTDYTYSVLAKKSNWGFLVLRTLNYDTTANARTWFNLNTGTVGSTSPSYHTNQKIEDFGNGWYLCSITYKSVTALTGIVTVSGASTNGSITAGTTNSEDIFYDAAQVEQGSYATSRIETSGSTVTRVADASSTSGLSSVINSVEGVLFADVIFFGGSFKFITINSGSSSNRVAIFSSNATQISYNVRVGGVNQFNGNFTIDSTIRHKLALKYKANDFALWIDGVEVVTLASGTTFSASTLTNFSLDDGGGGSVFNGLIQDLAIFPTALSDAQLEALTTI